MYLLRVYGASVVLQSRSMKMAFTALHACQGVGAVLCSLSCAAGSFWGWWLESRHPVRHGASLKSVTKPLYFQTPLSFSLLLPRTYISASRKEMVHYNKRSDTWFGLTAILDLKHKDILIFFFFFVTRCWQLLKEHTESMWVPQGNGINSGSTVASVNVSQAKAWYIEVLCKLPKRNKVLLVWMESNRLNGLQ